MTIQTPRPNDTVSEADLAGWAAARWLAAHAPERRATIDKAARAAFERFTQDAAAPEWAFIATLNNLRGMCADGCCGGVQEYEAGTAPDVEVQVDRYVAYLMRRGLAR